MPKARQTKQAKVQEPSVWKGQSYITTAGVTIAACEELFAKADELRQRIALGEAIRVAEGKVLALCFLEPSTRTMCSFSAAMQRLGGGVINVTPSDSSIAKGETLQDTIKCLASYADAIVLRHPVKGSTTTAKEAVSKPIISAGDGVGEHPTQALLDLYTIIKEHSPLPDVLHVTFLGDAKNGRTVHSLARLLARYLGQRVKVTYVCPVESLRMPRELYQELSAMGLDQHEESSMDAVLPSTDILYVTRVQKERFDSVEAYNQCKGTFVVNAAAMAKLKASARVLHPLPRVDEIDVAVDTDLRASYFRQMEHGMYVRMALLGLVLGVL